MSTKTKIIIGVVILTGAIIGFYFYNKNKKDKLAAEKLKEAVKNGTREDVKLAVKENPVITGQLETAVLDLASRSEF